MESSIWNCVNVQVIFSDTTILQLSVAQQLGQVSKNLPK